MTSKHPCWLCQREEDRLAKEVEEERALVSPMKPTDPEAIRLANVERAREVDPAFSGEGGTVALETGPTYVGEGGTVSFRGNGPSDGFRRLSISLDGTHTSVSFFADGSVTYDPSYEPSAVARVFWQAIAAGNPLASEVASLRARLRRAVFDQGEACPFCRWDRPRCECKVDEVTAGKCEHSVACRITIRDPVSNDVLAAWCDRCGALDLGGKEAEWLLPEAKP